jgi:GNAT superfamily N-acetyltransferase
MREIRHAQNSGSFKVNAERPDWLVIRHRIDHQNGHRYEAYDKADPSKPVGFLRYIKDFPKQGVVAFHELSVEPEYRKRGVALELCIRLHADTPGYAYDPGDNLEDGTGFSRQVLAAEPHANTLWYKERSRPEEGPEKESK